MKKEIDLGLEILAAIAEPGARFDQSEIARFCGCTQAGIRRIELLAMKKIRIRLKVTRYNQLLKE